MSKALGMRCVWGLCGVMAGVLALASVARAEVSTDVSGSVLVFPKVVYTGEPNEFLELERDTVLQLTNTSNNMVHVACFYVDARPDFFGNPVWQITDFQLWLTRQQPTHWVASQGRFVNPTDGFGNDGSGLDPGAIPPVSEGFEGELKCVQVDASGVPFGGNNLKGEAVIRSADGDVSKHNAIAILANPELAGAEPANELRLDNSPNNFGEYNACPQTTLLDHFVDGVNDLVIENLNPVWCDGVDGPGSRECPIRTYLTLVPCSQDFENAQFSSVTVQFAIVNELEENFSASTTVDCWATFRLADVDAPTGRCSLSGDTCLTDDQCIFEDEGFCNKNSVFSIGSIGTSTAFTRITPVDLDGGVLTVAEELRFNNLLLPDAPFEQTSNRTWAAWNPQAIGNRYDATDPAQGGPPGGPVVDTITLPDRF
jgi:hypothetical protein